MLLEHFLIAEVGTDDGALYFLVLLQRAIAFDLVPQTVVGPALEIVLKQSVGEVAAITAAVGVTCVWTSRPTQYLYIARYLACSTKFPSLSVETYRTSKHVHDLTYIVCTQSHFSSCFEERS